MSPTITTPAMTQVGMIMGTAAYMSPEQARGRAVDKRSDIWAFGCVLFEMLTGTRAFEGDDVSETLASVLAREPDWNRLPSDVPAVVAIYLRRCLQKNPKARIADVQDLRLALTGAFDVAVPTRDTSTPQEPTRPLWRRALPLVTTVLVVAVAAASAAWVMRPADSTSGDAGPSTRCQTGARSAGLERRSSQLRPTVGTSSIRVPEGSTFARWTRSRTA